MVYVVYKMSVFFVIFMDYFFVGNFKFFYNGVNFDVISNIVEIKGFLRFFLLIILLIGCLNYLNLKECLS